MGYQKIHTITEEMYQQLLDMLSSKDKNDFYLAEEIILNTNTDDLYTCHYLEEICLIQIMVNPYSNLVKFYINLKDQPNWKLVQEAHLTFQDDIFGLPDKF